MDMAGTRSTDGALLCPISPRLRPRTAALRYFLGRFAVKCSSPCSTYGWRPLTLVRDGGLYLEPSSTHAPLALVMANLALLRIELLSVIAEVLFFGAFCVLYPTSVWILVRRQHRGRRSRTATFWLTTIVTIMFLCVGTYLALDIHLLVEAYVDHSATPGGPLAYLDRPASNVSVSVSAAIFAFLTLLGDAFMAYRVFVVWDRSGVALVLSSLFLAGDVVTTALVGKALLQNAPTTYSDVVYIPGARSPLIAYFLMTILTNLGTTFLLLGRLYWHERRTRKYLPQDVYDTAAWRVTKTIMHSQAVYTIAVIFNLVTFLANSNLVFVTNAILPPLIGISFTLIIARIGLSEVLGSTDLDGSAISRPIEFSNRGRAGSPIAVNVFVSHTDDRSEGVVTLSHTKLPGAMT
ncbi:hypothetical protein VTO73DRAFT_4206 [Trametes versicolor]